MKPDLFGVVLKQFEKPDEVRTFEKGRIEVVRIGPRVVGRATYEPGWKWSEHVGPTVGATRCTVEHVGMVLSGTRDRCLRRRPTVELRDGLPLLHSRDSTRQLGGG